MEYVTKYVTFYYAPGGWAMNVWDWPVDGYGVVYTLRVEVPSGLIPPDLPGEIIVEAHAQRPEEGG